MARFLNFIIENPQDVEIKNDSKKLIEELGKFAIEHPIVEKKPKRWLFWDMFGNYD